MLFLIFFSLQFSPWVFQSSSSLDFYLRSTPFSCVCWSRLTCTFLVELVRNHTPTHRLYSFFSLPSNLSLCFSHYKPPVLTLQSVTQCVGSSSGLWLLPWCYHCKWVLHYKETYKSWFYDVMMHIFFYCVVFYVGPMGWGSCSSALLCILWPPPCLIIPLKQAKQWSHCPVVSIILEIIWTHHSHSDFLCLWVSVLRIMLTSF